MYRVMVNILLVLSAFLLCSIYGHVDGEPSIIRYVLIVTGMIILYMIIDYIRHKLKQNRNKELIKILEDIKSKLPDEKNNRKL
ncbi:chromate transport protein ChrA [Pedobacter sp. CG_S7]|uniref:hypothetical protein n=1 Tax=Pedobacter sp. CG_S7 TaxID=3143930 RepID=UPI00339B40A7